MPMMGVAYAEQVTSGQVCGGQREETLGSHGFLYALVFSKISK